MWMRRIIGTLYAASVIAGVTSAICFVTQGGFGGGHGDLDLLLWLLSLPWTLIAWPDVVQKSDFARLTLLPFIANVVAITLLRAALTRVMRSNTASNV